MITSVTGNTDESGASKRRHARTYVGGRVGRLQMWTGSWRTIDGTVIDVSQGGCGLIVDRQLPPGTWMRVGLSGVLDGQPRTVRDGRVVYAVPAAAAAPARHSAALAAAASTQGAGAAAGTLPAVPASQLIPSRWRVGVAFRPVAPSAAGLLATRALCFGILFLLWTGAGLQQGGIPTDFGVLLPFSIIVGALWVGAELYYHSERRRFRRENEAWQTSWAWYDAEGDVTGQGPPR